MSRKKMIEMEVGVTYHLITEKVLYVISILCDNINIVTQINKIQLSLGLFFLL